MIERKCLFCGKSFNFRACPTDVATGRGKYCSVSCSREIRRKHEKVFKCKLCGKETVNKDGKKRTYCSKRCVNNAKIGIKPWNFGLTNHLKEETIQLMKRKRPDHVPYNRGKTGLYKPSDYTRRKISSTMQGIGEEEWEGFRTTKIFRKRMSIAYKAWRNTVFHRDEYKCKVCGEKSKHLNAHHIIPVSKDEDKMFDVDNGITVCVGCHMKIHHQNKQLNV